MSDDDGLLSRWSRRKAQARSGKPPAEAPRPPVAVVPLPVPAQPIVDDSAPTTAGAGVASTPSPPPPPPPLPTLEDVSGLTHDSDFSRFVMPGVDEGVKRAAMKKLFSDPHFNVMDGLDTYIDDYGKPDPIPDAILRRMTQSKFLRLFDEDPAAPEPTAGATPPEASPDGDTPAALPQSHADWPGAGATEPLPSTDEDTALRLQPDDAAGPASAGPHRPGPRA